MTPLVIGVLLAVAAMIWVLAPVFAEEAADSVRPVPLTPEADAAAEAVIRRWRSAP